MRAEEGSALRTVLTRARDLGFLGPGAVADHIRHSAGFAAAHPGPAPRRVLDLGSGGGVPGLVLAMLHWPQADFVLLDAGARRTAFLAEAIDALGLAGRVIVWRARAEEGGRAPQRRATFDTVVSRSFGSPAVVAECAAPFLRAGGWLLVSEPPERPVTRWPAEGLAIVGLRPPDAVVQGVVALAQAELCPERYPRRTGVPAKRPLFTAG